MIYLRLFWEFFKTGLFAVGGGLATLPFLNKMGERFGWFTAEDVANMLAVSESTPGPIGVNMATYVGSTVGYAHDGILGGILCGVLTTLSLILPSYLVILAVQKIMSRFNENKYVQGVMKTLRPASVGMVCAAVVGILQSALLNTQAIAAGTWGSVVLIPNVLLFVAIFTLSKFFHKLHPIVFLLIGAAAGILLKL